MSATKAGLTRSDKIRCPYLLVRQVPTAAPSTSKPKNTVKRTRCRLALRLPKHKTCAITWLLLRLMRGSTTYLRFKFWPPVQPRRLTFPWVRRTRHQKVKLCWPPKARRFKWGSLWTSTYRLSMTWWAHPNSRSSFGTSTLNQIRRMQRTLSLASMLSPKK